jgi:hypothetical protein
MTTNSADSPYIAGACNIGPSEIHRRYQVAILGGIAFLALATYFIISDTSTALRLVAFLPAMGASVGFVQARRKFCLAYGFAGLFNFDKSGDVKKVVDSAALAADRAYAFKVLAISFIPAIALTAATLVL